jgi:hypothetical protein
MGLRCGARKTNGFLRTIASFNQCMLMMRSLTRKCVILLIIPLELGTWRNSKSLIRLPKMQSYLFPLLLMLLMIMFSGVGIRMVDTLLNLVTVWVDLGLLAFWRMRITNFGAGCGRLRALRKCITSFGVRAKDPSR